MNPLEKLKVHHEKLIGTIKSLAERARKTQPDISLLLSYCRQYLIPHAEGEEVTLYAACDDKDFVKKMIREHGELKDKLNTIDEAFTRRDTNGIVSGVNEFINSLDAHFNEEENTLMPLLSADLSQQNLESLIEEAHKIEKGKKISDIRALFEYDHKRIDMNIAALQSTQDEEVIEILCSKIRSQLLKHIELEESILFPAFTEQAAPNQTGPIQVMVMEHQQITHLISASAHNLDKKDLQSLIGLLAVHNKKEELILYPLINRTLQSEGREKIYKESFEKFLEV